MSERTHEIDQRNARIAMGIAVGREASITPEAIAEVRRRAEATADDQLSDFAVASIVRRTAETRAAGRGGWWRVDECPVGTLERMLRSAVEREDWRDALVLAAMVYFRTCAEPVPEKEV